MPETILNDVLDNLESIPLPFDRSLQQITGRDNCILLEYEKLHGNLVDIINQSTPYAIVLMMDNRRPNSRVGHYIALMLKDHELTVWDSYATGIAKLLRMTQNKPTLLDMIARSPYDMVENEEQLQELAQGISTCGRHAALRVLFGHALTNKQYASMMHSVDGLNPDELCTLMSFLWHGRDGAFTGEKLIRQVGGFMRKNNSTLL